MKPNTSITSRDNSKGATIFKKMIEDKRAIREHIQSGSKILELKGKFKFVKPLSSTSK